MNALCKGKAAIFNLTRYIRGEAQIGAHQAVAVIGAELNLQSL